MFQNFKIINLIEYHNYNFFKHTYCEFKMIHNNFFNQKSIHFKSKSGSLYYYTDDGVYRYSNHWGRVANCRWKISGIEGYKNQNYYVGYANWLDFYPLNTSEKLFYLKVDFNTKEVKIYRKSINEASTHFLMTLDFALKRLKQIKILFKEYKWAIYYNEKIEVLRSKLIYQLLNSDKSLLDLKQSLKNDLE